MSLSADAVPPETMQDESKSIAFRSPSCAVRSDNGNGNGPSREITARGGLHACGVFRCLYVDPDGKIPRCLGVDQPRCISREFKSCLMMLGGEWGMRKPADGYPGLGTKGHVWSMGMLLASFKLRRGGGAAAAMKVTTVAHLPFDEVFWFRVAPDDAESVEPLAYLYHLPVLGSMGQQNRSTIKFNRLSVVIQCGKFARAARQESTHPDNEALRDRLQISSATRGAPLNRWSIHAQFNNAQHSSFR